MYIHTPVLIDDILEFLKPEKSGSLLVDATLGEGGYADAFLSAYPGMKCIGIERDSAILEIAKQRLAGYKERIYYFNMWFNDFFHQYENLFGQYPDRVIFDLGISRYHYEKSNRGFSFSKDEPLDMRLSEELSLSAYDIINTFSEEELSGIFWQYGEERFSRRIARAIVSERKHGAIENAFALSEIIKRSIPRKVRYSYKIHPATRCFQALRIKVNSELERLKDALESAFAILKNGGRIGVVSYHSLEDRIVKRLFKEKNAVCTCPPDWPVCQCNGVREAKIITRKPIQPGTEEVDKNRAARSAKLRIIEKIVPGRDE